MRWLFKGILYLLLLLILGIGILSYKLYFGFPIYEFIAPDFTMDEKETNILVFSKTNGYNHEQAILSAKQLFDSLGLANKWKIYHSDNGALFSSSILSAFDLIIWNNVSGRVLTDSQRAHFVDYIEKGGGFLGIHAAGDFSHHWDWYEDRLIGAHFSHHTMFPQLQTAILQKECEDSFFNCESLPSNWMLEEEWYIFSDNPRNNGKKILYTVDKSYMDTIGLLSMIDPSKRLGMGKGHPIVWYGKLRNGRTMYSALGHTAASFEKLPHILLLESGIKWIMSPSKENNLHTPDSNEESH